ncbi:gibberellin 2-beta-dioxygenase 1 [Dorcoceras hygrometricum]|uniref:Gibberellin 2-beta-dioxygenase 1 n=1 Tax=Dorcoceras hygrometricum TaxID=472368 RepID=A0A2Z7AFP8_9LAMI|nr:gibberellin 2-beta-dioxygenase 1 [Dorcoceras hygrometricum]
MEKHICISAGKFFQAFFQSKHLDNDDEDSTGYQSYFRRKLKVIKIRSFAHKEKKFEKLSIVVKTSSEVCVKCCKVLGVLVAAGYGIGKEERYRRDEEDNERNVDKSKDKSKDKFKERSNDRRMKTSSNKRFSRKHDRKVLVAEESTKSWADSDSDSSSSSSSSIDSEQEEVHCFMADKTDDDEAERPVVTASDTGEEIATMDVAPADGDQQVQESLAPISTDDMLSADEQMSLDDIILMIPVDIPLPSSSMEITKIMMGKTIKIPGVTRWTWFLKNLPRIPADDKGKGILVEKDPIRGNPAREHFFLICADIDLLVELRAKVIDEVAQFLNSFSLKKLATINFEKMYKKEEQVLYWGETESPQVAIQRKYYILLKYRLVLVWKFLEAWRANFALGQGSSAVDIQVIEMLSDLHLWFLEELAKEARAHGLIWKKPCCSKIFEGSPRDRGAIIARNNTLTPSRCWIRTMLYVNGEWIVEPCADRWVKIPQLVISNEVPRQRQYDDTLPTRLLPAGSLQFCRSLQLVEPVSRIAPSRSPVFAFRVTQFCSIFVDFSLFNWFPSADISEFLSSVALDRTVLRSVQSSQNSFSVVPSVQLSLDQRPPSPTSTDSSSSLRFDTTDVDTTASSLPPVSQDLSAALADLQATLSEQIFEYQSGLSSKLHKIEQSVCDSLRDQADIFRNLSQGARQEARTLDDEVEEVNAKVDIMASRLNVIQKDAEATKEALSHQLLEFQSQAQENHNVIHAQLSELVDYIHRGSADKKEESGSRGLQQPANVQVSASAERTPSFAQRVEMALRHIVHTVLDADANRALLERQEAAEHDRERRRREASGISAVGVFEKSTDGMRSAVERFEIFSRYILHNSADALFKAYQQTVGSSTAYSFQQMATVNFNHQIILTSRCISKTTKRRYLNKLTRHRFNAKGISRWKNTYAYQQACYLAGTCAWLQPMFQEPGASRLIAVVTSIRSTTRSETPSSDCTRSLDEISTIGFSTKN